MSFDPIAEVVDEPLHIDADTMAALRDFRSKEKVVLLPGTDAAAERKRLASVLNALADTLIDGVEVAPSKLWVMIQFQRHLVGLEHEDTEAREHLGAELEEIMNILQINSSDGLLAFYLGGI